MELVSTQPQSQPQSTILIGENYQTMLKESIDQFLNEISRGISDFSGFVSIFFRLLHARVNPPLETIWFYSAVSFKTSVDQNDDVLTRVLKVKDLFQLLTTCSVSCNGLKSVAVISPVFYELWKVGLFQLLGKKALREIECLVEGVVSYVSICGCEDFGGNDKDENVEDLVTCFGDLVRVWTSDKAKGNVDVGESLKVFFPLVSEGIIDGLKGEVGVGYLAGVVIVQAFLLRLCLKLNAGVGLSKTVLQKELTSWAVCSITAFKNCCFFEILLKLLLESTLPVTSLLDSGDEAILRKVLCDAVILVDYSFLNNETETILTSHLMIRLAITRLIVAHEAIQDARKSGDQTKAISYINAFSRSRLPSTMVKWVTTQIGMDKKQVNPMPVLLKPFLVKWLLNFEQRGAKIFNNNALRLRAKSVFDESKADFEQRLLQPYSKVEDDLLFYIDNKREEKEEKKDDQEMLESINDAFTTAAHMMKFTANDERRKRKENRKSGDKSRLKFLKYNLHEHSVKKKFLPSDAHSSESEEENTNVDEEMEELDG
ncbi:hypothetical protein IFM89_021640 [Coptis chinensis]|uniref:Uncharacterized protein n=1 Tax=Coptis chinensis TaxID=261450 RepID=A0A835M5Y9_9MAGN|nr:hypothetical protein IFM89_021640 [Coptis chinensis]